MERRSFLAGAGSAAASLYGASADPVRLAIIGTGGRGQRLIRDCGRTKECRVTAVCDIDRTASVTAAQMAAKTQGGPPPAIYQDLRRAFDDKQVDAVMIATCNHWHALATVWGCQAGKDVYVEKPASHNIFEGRRMVDAAARYKRVVQCGLQARSIDHYRRAIGRIRAGAIGKVFFVRGVCFRRRESIGRRPDGPVPAGVDYDMWLGPAPRRPFNPNRFHYNWHWFWATGNGDIGNQGVHELDIARWGLGKDSLPVRVHSCGGKFVYDDDQETPNMQVATYEYDDCQIVFEVRGFPTAGEDATAGGKEIPVGDIFFGTQGTLALDSYGYRICQGEKREVVEEVRMEYPTPWDNLPHILNFVRAVRSRDAASLTCPVLEGHISSALPHLANISYRTGRKLRFDGAAEKFPGDTEANGYLKRDYRAPFVVPEKV